MLTNWSASYTGPHHGVILKKLERLAKIKLIDVKRERLIFLNEKIEHASFLVEHQSNTWEDLLASILNTAHLISPFWRITIGEKALIGEASKHIQGTNIECQISGLCSICWEANAAQNYKRTSYLNGQPNHW